MSRLSQRLIGRWPMPIILFLLFFCISLVFPQKVTAVPADFVKAVQQGNNLQWYLGGDSGMIATTMDSLTVSIVGARDEQGNIISSGAIQTTSFFMASLYKQPISSVDYLAHLINNSGITKTAYAQGSGWNFLTSVNDNFPGSPILSLWTISRNVVYLLFVIIFVAIGFMIMFRSKLNPQTVVNVQLALPSIIVSLILVTFSFAICGLIIDFVFLGNRLVDAVYFTNTSSPLYNLIDKTVLPVLGYPDIVEKIDIVSALFFPSKTITTGWGAITVWDQFAKFILTISETIKNIFKGNVSGLIPLILAFSLLGTGLKIFFGLITKYVTILLSTIFSPFVFLLSSFPGKTEGIANFLKTMLSAALTFPATAFMFFLSSYFVSTKIGLNLNALPPLNKAGILLPGSSNLGVSNVLEPLIGLGILMAATQIPQTLDQMLGVKAGIAGAATPEIGGALRKIPLIGSLLG